MIIITTVNSKNVVVVSSIVCVSCVGASVFKLLSNLITPQDPVYFTYNEALVKFMVHFKPKTLKTAERFGFYKQIKREMTLSQIVSLN